MGLAKATALLVTIALLSACGGGASRAQKRAYRAEEAISKQRLDLVEQYQQCVADAGNDLQKIEACDSYLRAAEALK